MDKTTYYRSQNLIFEEGDLEPDKRTMLAFHPHGILCCGWSTTVVSAVLRAAKVTFLVADTLFMLPGIREMLLWNNTRAADSRTMRKLMAAGTNIALLPGASEEAVLHASGRYRVYIKNRKGFIKYALQSGYVVRPVYCFGEEATFKTFTPAVKPRLWIARVLKFPAVLFTGGSALAFYMPRRDIDINVVVGPPLQLPKIEAPTAEEVALWHLRYMVSLDALFNCNKAKYCKEGSAATLEVY